MDNFQKKVSKCTDRLSKRQNMEFVEDFCIEKLGLVENNISAIMEKLDIF
jgi:hypothetical protein